jgi:hypothetical protein
MYVKYNETIASDGHGGGLSVHRRFFYFAAFG